MDSKIIFFEGQPGCGKSTLSQFIHKQLELNDKSAYWLDEYEHEEIQFGDFWRAYGNDNENIVDILLNCWKEIIRKIENSNRITIMDSSFFSHTLYLLNLEITKDKTVDYFKQLNVLLSKLNPRVVFLKGDTESIISRACNRRGKVWTDGTIKMIEDVPYQKSRNRTGFQGMVEYFTDAQKLYFDLSSISKFSILQIDVTEENWNETEKEVLSWLGYERVDDTYALDHTMLERYCGRYQVPENFPARGEKLEIVLENNLLILKGTYWKDYKLIPKSETHFLIRGISMELDFKLKEGQITGFDYTFIDRNTYTCTKVG